MIAFISYLRNLKQEATFPENSKELEQEWSMYAAKNNLMTRPPWSMMGSLRWNLPAVTH